jgi:protein-tyrosine phosphatase
MDFSQITDSLFIGTTPLPNDYEILRKLDVGLVINMRVERRPYADPHSSPIPALWLPTCDSPLFPIPLRKLHRGVAAALATFDKGQKVYAHCAAGVHRSVALGASILIARGYSVDEAIQLIKERRKVADPHAWYIFRRIEHFANNWSAGLKRELKLVK